MSHGVGFSGPGSALDWARGSGTVSHPENFSMNGVK